MIRTCILAMALTGLVQSAAAQDISNAEPVRRVVLNQTEDGSVIASDDLVAAQLLQGIGGLYTMWGGGWFRVLKPGGTVVAFEGNWINPDRLALWLRRMARRLGKTQEPGKPEAEAILSQLPFRGGLTQEDLARRLAAQGFDAPSFKGILPITRAQLAGANLAEKLSLLSYTRGRFMMVTKRPEAG